MPTRPRKEEHYIVRTAADTVVDAAAALLGNNVEASPSHMWHAWQPQEEGFFRGLAEPVKPKLDVADPLKLNRIKCANYHFNK